MAPGDLIDVESLALFSAPDGGAGMPTFRQAKSEFERSYVMQVLRATGGKVAAAARLAGKDRKDFYDLMRKHRIMPDEYRGSGKR